MTPLPRLPIGVRGRAWAMLCLAMLLGGCVTNGDFGRVRAEFVSDDMHDWVGRDAVARSGELPSELRLTDQERSLRDLAFALIEPPYKRNRWDSVWREYGLGRSPAGAETPFDRTIYFAKLHHDYRRSEASAYARIVTDARNDVERLPGFFTVAGRVIDMDHKRAASLAHVSTLGPGERTNAYRRNNENKAIVAWVCRAVKKRVTSYRFALERLVIAVPSPGAAETDRSINFLHTQLGGYCARRAAIAAQGRAFPSRKTRRVRKPYCGAPSFCRCLANCASASDSRLAISGGRRFSDFSFCIPATIDGQRSAGLSPWVASRHCAVSTSSRDCWSSGSAVASRSWIARPSRKAASADGMLLVAIRASPSAS